MTEGTTSGPIPDCLTINPPHIPTSTQVRLHHRTTYRYDHPVSLSPHLIRLRPAPHAPNSIRDYDLRIAPADHILRWQQDPYANFQARVLFPTPTTELSIEVQVLVDMVPVNPFDFFLEESATNFPFHYSPKMSQALLPYLQLGDEGPQLRQFRASPQVQALLKKSKAEGGTVDFLVDLAALIAGDLQYETRLEPGVQPVEVTLDRKAGSCRDSAWLLVQLLRQFGVAARFVSGYLIQLTPRAAQDTVDLHAWCEAYLPGAGWIGIDTTSGLLAGEGHVPLAASPSPEGAAPIVGLADPAVVEFDYSNTIVRV